MDPAVLIGLSLICGGLAAVAPIELSIAATLSVLLLRQSMTRWVVLAIGLALGISGLRGYLRLVEFEWKRSEEISSALKQQCSGEVEVLSSPVKSRGALRWDGEVREWECEAGGVLSGRVTLFSRDGVELSRGDIVRARMQVDARQRYLNPFSPNPAPKEARHDVVASGAASDLHVIRRGRSLLALIDRARNFARREIERCFSPQFAPMARALVLGESDLSNDDAEAFQKSGLAHLLAVSGMHLVLVIGGVKSFITQLFGRIEAVAARVDTARWSAGLSIGVTWFYTQFSGDSGSARRAASMLTVALLAEVIGRKPCAWRAFGLSLVAIGVADPLAVFDLSFSLSAAATAGLLAAAPLMMQRRFDALPRPLAMAARSLGATCAAAIPCVPILAQFAPTMSVAALGANLLAVPLGEFTALPLCLVEPVLSAFGDAQRGCAVLAQGALRMIRAIAHFTADCRPFLVAVTPLTAAEWVGVALFVVLIVRQRLGGSAPVRGSESSRFYRWAPREVGVGLLLIVALVGVSEAFARRSGAPRGQLRVTFLDVGQGDSAIVDFPDGTAMVVDGGGAVGASFNVGALLANELRSRRRNEIAVAALSHPHPDHYLGLLSGLDAVHVREVWDTGQGEFEEIAGEYQHFLDKMRKRAVPIVHPHELCGRREVGGATVEILAPCPSFTSDYGPNDNSLVFRVSYGGRSVLFVGDAEGVEEAALVSLPAEKLHADVLKVGHHGSRTSSSAALIAAVRPRHAVISVGIRNRFGHPSAEVLETLEGAGAAVWRTDRDGAITMTTDGNSLEVRASD